MACAYITKTLVAGEQLILPAGAEIIRISDTEGITSGDCTLDLTKLETPVTYEFKWASTQEATNGATQMYQAQSGSNNHMNGIFVNNVFYVFSSFIDYIEWDYDLQSRFNSTPFNGVIYDASRTFYDDDETSKERGMGAKYRFTTIPSIGDNMEISFYTTYASSRFGELNGSNFEYRTKPYRV